MEKFAIEFIAFFYALINNFDLKKISTLGGLLRQLSVGLAIFAASRGKAGKTQAIAAVVAMGQFIDETRKQISPADRAKATKLLNDAKKASNKITKKKPNKKAAKKVVKKAPQKKGAKKAAKKAQPKKASKKVSKKIVKKAPPRKRTPKKDGKD